MFKKISGFLFLGFIATIFFAQFDPWVHNKLKNICQDIACQSLGCNATFTIESLNFFSASMVLNNVEMLDVDNKWLWKCQRCEVYSSWIQLLLKGVMDRHIVMEGFECSSCVYEGRAAIESHILALNSQSLFPIPTDLKSIVFKNSCLSFYDESKKGTMSLLFNSSSLRVGNQLKTMMSIYDGAVNYCNVIYSNDIVADVSLVTWYENDLFMYVLNGSGLLHLPQMLDQGTCYVSGMLESGRGRFSIRNAYNSFTIDPIVITEREIRADVTLPLSYVMRCIDQTDITDSVQADVKGSVRIDKQEGKVDGHFVIQDGAVVNTHVCDVAKIIFARKDQKWKLRLNIARYNEECKGIGYWNEKLKQGQFEFHNSTPLSSSLVPHWRIMPKNLLCYVLIDRNEAIGVYKINTANVLSKAYHTLCGGCSYETEGLFSVNGILDSTEFDFKSHIGSTLTLRECSFLDKDKKALVSLHESDDKNSLQGHILFTFIRNFINTFFHYDIQGEGTLALHGHVSLADVSMDVTLDDATIRLPETYNFIDGLQTHISCNIAKKLFLLNNTRVSLHTGTMSCLQATAFFNETGHLTFAHAPILLNRCLFNIKKDLFAIISGNLLFSCIDTKSPSVSGNIIIDRAQLKENLFSSVIQKQLFSYTHSVFSMPGTPVMCDLSIETKSPIRVDTAFLQTNAKVNLRIQNNIIEPTVSGIITLQSGNLIFPYKPLFISKGVLTFSSEQFLDPAIELVARNKIKNHDISLQIAGSLLNHHIMLDSTPPLSEEQIMTLLLVGSQESSLNSMIPALIVQNLKNLIFTNNQSTFLEKYFSPLLRPFNISLIPSFADQTGRGGLRGMLEISIDDRWKAMIQKNFSLTEDTRVELEFLLSDDITLRGIRDERRDLGGEVEMRWKF